MFCPSCGMEEIQSNQFCRSCGTDLRPVRTVIAMPDSVTASAISARDHIGRAIADKLREADSPGELKVFAEDVLPQIEKFLESPAERRLRRMRAGTVVASVGLGVAVAISIASILMSEHDLIFIAALGAVTFFIGLGLLINGYLLTTTPSAMIDNSDKADNQRKLDEMSEGSYVSPSEINPRPTLFNSVVENTTKHLNKKISDDQ